jgi:uncharacterized protein (TIGR02145 family)
MEVILWVGGILLLLWVLFQINKIGIIEEKIGVIVAKLDKLEKLDNLDFSDKLDDIIELLPKPTKSQIPENLYILKIDGITTDSILLTDIPKFLVDAKNTYVWDNEKLIWKHILLFDEIVSFCQIVTQYPLNWTSKNLDVDKFRNGDIIPEAKTDEEWELAGINGTPAWCYYDNDLDNGLKYGKLYNWFAVNDPRGLAPVGYHIPNDREWSELENLLGKEAGKKLKSKYGWEDSVNGTDLIGFNAIPGGYRHFDGSFTRIRDTAGFWSATESSITRILCHFLNLDISNVSRFTLYKSSGASVRCIRD